MMPSPPILILIWWSTVVLAVASLIAMTALTVYRAIRNRRLRQDDLGRARLQRLALTLIREPDKLLVLRKELRRSDRRLLLDVFDALLPKIRGEYAERLVNMMRILGLMEECLAQLQNRSWARRAQACMALGVFRDPAVILALYRALEDRVPAVRVEAARSLARLGAVRSVVELVDQLIPGDEMPSLQVTDLFRALGREAVPQLVGLLDSEEKVAAKVLAADALGHIGDLSALPALLPLYDHASMELRLTVMQALARLQDPRALPATLLAMLDPAWELRAQAAACAGQIGSPQTIPLLEDLLRDDQWWVRYYAAEALFKIGGQGVRALQAAARGDHLPASEMASGMLQEKGVAA